MRILGISCFFHDAAACLVEDGRIVAAAQEERFTRIKHDPRFPLHAINYCLEQAGCGEEDLDVVAFHEKPVLVLDRIAESLARNPPNRAAERFAEIVESWRNYKLDFEQCVLSHLGRFRGRILLADHHQAHAASAFFPSPFDEAAILTIDGVGEWNTATIGVGHGREIQFLREMNFPHSVGLLYSAFTSFIGFKVNSGEYKVMGLAPYGHPVYRDLICDNVVAVHDDGSIALDMRYFDFGAGNRMTTTALEELFTRRPRARETRITQFDVDLAASIQAVVQEILLKMAAFARKETGAVNLCLSGGVALNCVAVGDILRSGLFRDIWVQPASGDAGSAVGTALAVWHTYMEQPRTALPDDSMSGAFLGPGYTTEEIADQLDLYGFPYEVISESRFASFIADRICQGEVIGLFQGRMEFGPRALGARSIVADPRLPENQARVNLKVKFRESFRPFAPAVLRENVSEWFEFDGDSPYMTLVAPVKKERRVPFQDPGGEDLLPRLNKPRSEIPAVTHMDYSARIQTVDRVRNPRFYAILEAFKNLTGVPVLLNTSFNLRGEPIVLSPLDAYRCMMRSDIDCIVMENIVVRRNLQPRWPERKGPSRDLPLD